MTGDLVRWGKKGLTREKWKGAMLESTISFISLALLRIHDILVWIRIWIHRSLPLTNGSGFGSGSCYFHHWPSRRQQKTNLNKSFYAYYWLNIHMHNFSKKKVKKKSQNSRNQGSIPLTNESGSGSRRPKNMWIPWIRIRIHNTAP
jgi:hypothetical protein